MLLAALVTFAVIVGIGFLLGGLWRWYLIAIAIPAALLAAVFVMNRRGNKAMYGVLEGQAGAAGAALQSMGTRGWYASTEPVAVDVNRASKPSDLAGVGDGLPCPRAPRRRPHRRGPQAARPQAAQGRGEEGQSRRSRRPRPPLGHRRRRRRGQGEQDQLQAHPHAPVLTKDEASVVNKRLKSLGGLRTGVPAGMDPTRARVDRKAMRGK